MKKRFAIPVALLIIFVFACNKDENPTCEDGILNGNETGIDCGGDCDPCFICTTNYCSLLAGATTNEAKTYNDWQAIGANWRLTFHSDGVFRETGDQTVTGIWEFDDPESPNKLKLYYKGPMVEGIITNFILIKLVSDTLIIEDEYGPNTFLKQ